MYHPTFCHLLPCRYSNYESLIPATQRYRYPGQEVVMLREAYHNHRWASEGASAYNYATAGPWVGG